jgi:hypothetical protein
MHSISCFIIAKWVKVFLNRQKIGSRLQKVVLELKEGSLSVPQKEGPQLSGAGKSWVEMAGSGLAFPRVKGGKRGLGVLSADHESLQCPEPSRALMGEFWGASREPDQVGGTIVT